MITRIVRLPIDPEHLSDFLKIFEQIQNEIGSQPGCINLELFADVRKSGQVFTKSEWEDEEALNNYRNSELFKSTWPEVKKLFTDRAQAWTLSKL
ncbi:MAG: antibiotic biosynthesis monooxygenase [Bacteroidia bacterium]|nr:antibiotic biosynthesis monooxygenase [Bacteroidia bacterium]